MGAKPGGRDRGTRPPNIFVRGDTNAFVSTNFCMTQSQSSVIKISAFIFFYYLKSVITILG